MTNTERDDTQKWERKTDSFVILGQKEGGVGGSNYSNLINEVLEAKTLEQLAAQMQDRHMQES